MTSRMATARTRAASLDELRVTGKLVVALEGHTICLMADGDNVYAIDNRCPHMGFPLHRGTVIDGILTCHWHHARFDLCTGGTFDQWADDVRQFPVEIDGEDVYVNLILPTEPLAHQRTRLHDGLERNLALVLAKAAIASVEAEPSGIEAFQAGLDFGVRRRGGGWFRGLTTLTCLMNLVPRLEREERAAALYHGLADVASDSAMDAPHFPLAPLPGHELNPQRLNRWFRGFVEVRDAEGAERALVSAVRAGASSEQLADMLFSAATDHRYLDGGHTLDFINKAFEALDTAGWERAEAVLASLPAQLASAARMEESNAWRSPVDLVALLEAAFDGIAKAVAAPRSGTWSGRSELIKILLDSEASDILDALLTAFRDGAHEIEVASAVTFAAATRIARFPTSNEFADWDTALHTFTFANAVEQGLRRSPAPELLRGVLDAAMSIHLDRFLNVPATRLPEPDLITATDAQLEKLSTLLDGRQQVDETAQLVTSFLAADGDRNQLIAALGASLLREDRDFHTIQCVEAAIRQHDLLHGNDEAGLPLIAAVRYLAAHAPTARSQRQTYEIARRLHRGERIYEDDPQQRAASQTA
jgi:nitrite reductase/ring-hydroxylating ferredoxin subunit